MTITEKPSNLEKKILLGGAFGLCPIPIAGEIGLFAAYDGMIKTFFSMRNIPTKFMAAGMSVFTRAAIIYPMYEKIFEYISK